MAILRVVVSGLLLVALAKCLPIADEDAASAGSTGRLTAAARLCEPHFSNPDVNFSGVPRSDCRPIYWHKAPSWGRELVLSPATRFWFQGNPVSNFLRGLANFFDQLGGRGSSDTKPPGGVRTALAGPSRGDAVVLALSPLSGLPEAGATYVLSPAWQ